MAENWEEMREKNGKNRFRLASSNEWGNLCEIAIVSVEVISLSVK